MPRRPVKHWVSEDTRPRLRMWLPPEKAAGYLDAAGPVVSLGTVVVHGRDTKGVGKWCLIVPWRLTSIVVC
jgi:hypothetical protein